MGAALKRSPVQQFAGVTCSERQQAQVLDGAQKSNTHKFMLGDEHAALERLAGTRCVYVMFALCCPRIRLDSKTKSPASTLGAFPRYLLSLDHCAKWYLNYFNAFQVISALCRRRRRRRNDTKRYIFSKLLWHAAGKCPVRPEFGVPSPDNKSNIVATMKCPVIRKWPSCENAERLSAGKAKTSFL